MPLPQYCLGGCGGLQQSFLCLVPGKGKALYGGGRQVEASCAVGGDGVFQRVDAGWKVVDEDVETVGCADKLCGYGA